MKIIRYAVLALVLVGATSIPADGDLKSLVGQAEPTKEPRAIPKAWGRLASVVNAGALTWFYFEAPDGTVRSAVASLQWVLVERGTWVRK